MLSRTAEYLYWISRYMERAETTARLLDVGYRMSLFPNPSGYNNEWESVLSAAGAIEGYNCLLYTSPSPRDRQKSRMPSSA